MFEKGKQNQQHSGDPVDRVHLPAGGYAGGERGAGPVRKRKVCVLAHPFTLCGNAVLLGVDDGFATGKVSCLHPVIENQGRKTFSNNQRKGAQGGSRPCRPFYLSSIQPSSN